MSAKYKIAIASSTAHGVMCAQVLAASPLFEVVAVLTPAPRPIGRHKILTANPLHVWARASRVPTLLVEKKLIDLRPALTNLSADFLLVVDFGYFIPAWLLAWPKISPVNIHPSALPQWRGASPGQFVLLSGDTKSAVSLITVTAKMDQGDIIVQLPFSVSPTWTQQNYYQFAFELMVSRLPQTLSDFASGKIAPTPQPLDSPTPIARQLTKSDAYVNWQTIALTAKLVSSGKNPDVSGFYIKNDQNASISYNQYQKPLLISWLESLSISKQAALLERACRAFSGWPQLWTIFQGQRLQILSCHLENNTLILDLVKPEGKTAQPFLQFWQATAQTKKT